MILSLAPMADITHAGFRRLVASFASPDLYYSEMIHSPSLLSRGKFEKWYMLTLEGESLIWQLTSDESETIKESIPLLLEKCRLGIDLNMGCCAPHIVATGAGFAWLKKDRCEVARYVRNARDSIDEYVKLKGGSRPILSVKMRLPSERQEDLDNFVRFLVDLGVDRVTVHPRFQKEKYARLPHYEYVERLLNNIPIPLFLNGDIQNAEDIKKISKNMPTLAGCMIGREAVRRPWIFAKLKKLKSIQERQRVCSPVSSSMSSNETQNILFSQSSNHPQNDSCNKIDLLRVAQDFIEYVRLYQPAEFQLLRSKRFFSIFCDNFQFAHYIRTRLLNTKTLEDVLPILHTYFDEVEEDRWR